MHTLSLAEALFDLGADVTVVALGDPDRGFFRPVRAPYAIVPAPPDAASLQERVFRSVDALAAGLHGLNADAGPAGLNASVSRSHAPDRFDVFHAQDCIAARAAARVRDSRAGTPVIRTVHHVDDFTTPALVDCQRRAIHEPDQVLVVSRHWRDLLRSEYGVDARVVHNGVDGRRFPPLEPEQRASLRHRVGAVDGRFLFLGVGGIEPRKGSVHLLEALAETKRLVQPSPVLAVVGGHSFQDYAAYREAALAALPGMGLELGRDVVLLGTVPDDELAGWYGAADALAFPSLKEGWGLAVLEAMSAGLPVIATDIPVFREYLTDRRDALLVPPADSSRLAGAMQELISDEALRHTLVSGGRDVAARYTWDATAREHLEVYDALVGGSPTEAHEYRSFRGQLDDDVSSGGS